MATWKEKYNKKYQYKKNKSHNLSDISKDTGVSRSGLQKIYNKGIGAYKTNPQSVRPNVTSKEQWAMARVYSSVMGGKASKIDKKELNMEKGGSTDFNPDGNIKDKVVHASGDAGGMLVGKRHSNGGIKALNKSTGQPLEMEGGEVVITRNAVSDNKKRSFNGKMLTNRQILSEINESGGGVSFADGGKVPNNVKFDCNAEYEYGGKTMCGKDLAYALGGDVYAKGGTIECGSCDWSWDEKDGGDDMYVCHKCGTDNTNEYKNGGITIKNNNMKKNNLIKPKRKGKNIMTLAKEIRKKDESWQDALKRAKIEMNKTSSKKSSNIDSELGKLKELIKEDKILKEYNYSKKNTKKSNTRLQKGGDVMSLGIANADAVYNKGGDVYDLRASKEMIEKEIQQLQIRRPNALTDLERFRIDKKIRQNKEILKNRGNYAEGGDVMSLGIANADAVYNKGGEVLEYSKILDILTDKIDDAVEDIESTYEQATNTKGEEVESKSRDGFIPFTNGGYSSEWFEYSNMLEGSGMNLPTKSLDDEIEKFRETNRNYGLVSFEEEYPEIVKELGGIDNVNYSELEDAGYMREADDLDMFMQDDDDSILMKVEAFYYNPNNDRGENGKHTIQLSGVVNLEAPYHRSGNLEDYIEERFTFDTLKELEDKLDKGLAKVVSWFEGDMYDKNPRELKIRRMKSGGKFADGGDIPVGFHKMPNGEIMADSEHLAKGGLITNQSEKHLMQVLIGLGMKSKSIFDKNKPYFDEEDRELLRKMYDRLDEEQFAKGGKTQGGEIDDMTFDELYDYLRDKDEGNWDIVNSEGIVRMYIDEMKNDGINVSHIEEVLENNPSREELYKIDLGYSLNTPIPINTKEDLLEALELDKKDYAKGGKTQKSLEPNELQDLGYRDGEDAVRKIPKSIFNQQYFMEYVSAYTKHFYDYANESKDFSVNNYAKGGFLSFKSTKEADKYIQSLSEKEFKKLGDFALVYNGKEYQIRKDIKPVDYAKGGEIDDKLIRYYKRNLEKVKSSYPTNPKSNNFHHKNQDYVDFAEKELKEVEKGRKYADGGTIGEYPRVYIADLEAYNNGELKGEWLDLADYNDSEEFNDAVQNLLDGWGVEEYAIHDVENFPDGMYSEYMGTSDFDEIYDMILLAKNNDLPLDVVMEVVTQYDESALEEYQGQYEDGEDFASQMIDDIGLENFSDPQYFVDISDMDRRIMAQEMADSYTDDIAYEDDGERVVEEAGLDVDEYRELDGEDDDKRDEILEEAKEIVRDEYYETWYDGLDDPYDFLVNEQGIYSDEDFFKANFIQIDYGELANALEQDYLFIENDKGLFVFNVR